MAEQRGPSIHFQFNTGHSRVQNGHTYFAPRGENDTPNMEERPTNPLDRIVQKLSFDQLHARRQNIRQPSPNTGKWILETRQYMNWVNAQELHAHHGFFWIRGKPGVGKSVLMNYLLTESANKMPDAKSISFFFHARGHELEKTVIGLYRSLLWQLMEAFSDLKTIFTELDFISPNSIERNGWQEQGLKNMISCVIGKLRGRQLACYIDALDECPEEQVRDMIFFLQDISEQAIERGDRLNICFSSRHYPNISIKRALHLTIEDQRDHRRDIERYIDSTLVVGSSRLGGNIKKMTLLKSSGVFLWVVLIIPMLNKAFDRGKIYALNEELHRLPSKLSDLFQEMLMRDSEDQDAMLLCIQLVLFARRPLSLRELYFAIKVGLEYQTPQATSVTEDSMRRYILNSSKGLVEEISTRSMSSMQFIHDSIRSFFLYQENGLQKVWPHLRGNFIGQSQDAIRQICFWQISSIVAHVEAMTMHVTGFDGVRRESTEFEPSEPTSRVILVSAYPFLEYAVNNVLFHSDEAESLGVSQSSWIQCFSLATWTDLHYIYNVENRDEEDEFLHAYEPDVNILYVLAQENLIHLVRQSPDRMRHLDVKGGYYGTPLVAALACGCCEVAQDLGFQVFLDQGLNI